MSIKRLTVVYNSKSGILGDVVYILRKVAAGESCSLCDITHGVREKAEWKACKTRLGVPIDTKYRNQMSGEMREVIGDRYPTIVAEDDTGFHVFVDSAELEACGGSVAQLEALLRERLDEQSQ